MIIDSENESYADIHTMKVVYNMTDNWAGHEYSTTFTLQIHSSWLNLPSFKSAQDLITLTVGTPYEWYLPEIDEGDIGLADVRVQPAADIDPYITFTKYINTLYYDGNGKNETLSGNTYDIKVDLINLDGESNVYYH